MPSLGADMEAGTLVEWLKKPGEAVKRGDVVAVVETQKGAIEIEIFEAGVLDRILVQPGEKVPVGTLLATLRSNGAQEPEPAPPRPPPELPPQPEPPPAPRPPERPYQPPPERPPLEVPPEMPPSPAQPPVEIPEPEASGGVRVRMTPAARRRAAELVLSPSGIRGTGPDGTISLADVEAAASRGPVATPVQRAPRPGFDPAEMRKAIAAAMARSKREIPHYYLTQTVDLRRALAWLEEANRERPPTERLLPAVLFLKATALALRKVPELNGFWQKDGFRARRRHPRRLGDLAAGRWPDRPGHPRRRPAIARRADGGDARPRPARPRRRPAQLGAVRPDDHGDQSRRAGGGDGDRRHLPAAGRDHRLRADRRAALGGRRRARRSARGQRSASPPTTAPATATAAACCSPRSNACCRSPKPYDRSRTAQDGPGHAGRHRPRGRPRRVAAGQGPAARSSTSTPWTS